MLARRFGAIEGVLWIGVGLLICILSWRAHLGSFREPGPGFMAFMAGLFITGVGVYMVVSQAFTRTVRDNGFDVAHAFRGVPWSRIGYVTLLLFAYAAFLRVLGYVLTTFFMMWALFLDRRMNNWVVGFLKSLIIVTCSYLIFEVWLRCQFPRGFVPWW